MAILGDGARVLAAPSYEFLRTIVEGNAGITKVYRHTVLGTLRVQKTISVAGVRDGLAQSEPRLLEELDHARLIKVREAQWDPDYPAPMKMITFTTDYYPGESIHSALVGGHSFSTKDALDITACVLEGLHYLHVTARIVHRDIKPGNVMLDAERRHGFVGDFGSAARLEPSTGDVIASAGTLLYRPPEYSDGRLDGRSDLYSSGMTLFEMLNGPFDYANLSHDALEQRAESGKPAVGPKHLRFAPWVSPSVATFTRKLMHPDRAQRFASAADALRAVSDLSYVDWARTGGGEWIGRWPPRLSPDRQRLLRVRVEAESARYPGQVKFAADWSTDGGRSWRGYASLTRRRVPTADSGELAAFFRSVEARAQSVAVR